MSRMKTGFTALALIMSLGLITAPGVFAKAHDQSGANGGITDGNPGTNVGTETVGNAHDMLGNGPPDKANLGVSESDRIGRGGASGQGGNVGGRAGSEGGRAGSEGGK